MMIVLALLLQFIIEGVSTAQCPPLDPNAMGLCAFMCNPEASESTCPKGKICCSTGCGYTCMAAAPTATAEAKAESSLDAWAKICPQKTNPEEMIDCSGNKCILMRCAHQCCFDGCRSYCVSGRGPENTLAPSANDPIPSESDASIPPSKSLCPWEATRIDRLGCTANLCWIMRCKGRCCYDGCNSFCTENALMVTTRDLTCPMEKEKRRDPNCFEDSCPVMDCRGQCCYDGCSSFCDPNWCPNSAIISDEPGCEYRCPEMSCRDRCCFDGCISFCQEERSPSDVHYYNNNNNVASSASFCWDSAALTSLVPMLIIGILQC